MCSPVTPSWARSTTNPSASRPRFTAAASRRSSSTTSTRTFSSVTEARTQSEPLLSAFTVPSRGDPLEPPKALRLTGTGAHSGNMQAMRLSRNARWAVPAAVVVVTSGAIAGSVITVAQAAPNLPPKTPAQLLADIASTQKIPALTGTVVETASLGLPALPQTGNPTSLASLITGSHTIKVYWQDATHFRLALPETMKETDLIRNGSTLWEWDSASNSVTKYSLAGDGKPVAEGRKCREAPGAAPAAHPAAGRERRAPGGRQDHRRSVDSAVTVAGQAAYESSWPRRTAAQRSARSASRSTARPTSRCASRCSRRGQAARPSRSAIPTSPMWPRPRRTSPSPRRPARPSMTRLSRTLATRRRRCRTSTAPPVATGPGGSPWPRSRSPSFP